MMKLRKISFKQMLPVLLLVATLVYFPLATILAFDQSKLTAPEQFSNTYLNRYIIELKTPENKNAFKTTFHQKQILSKQHTKLWNLWKSKELNLKWVGQLYAVSNAMIIESPSLPLLEKIRQHPEVNGIYCVNEYYLQRNISVPSIMAPEVWKKTAPNGIPILGNQIKIGVIDTGIEYWHGDMGGGIGKKPDGSFYKVISGYDFAEMNAISYDSAISFHGTHVAGIIAGYGQAGIASGDQIGKGVAPQANLISYKVFTNNNKSTGSDAILLALDQAVIDGCDVINLSLGRFFGWSDDFLSLACQRIFDQGIIVVASAGNEGEKDQNYNIYPINAPSSGKDVLSVGSIDETNKFGFSFNYKGELYQFPGKLFQNSPSFSHEPIAVCFFDNEGKELDYKDKDVTGKIVCLKRGGNTFAEKNAVAKQFGAAGIIIYNFTKGWFTGFLNPDTENIPSMSISQEAGQSLKNILKDDPEIKIRFETKMKCTVISDFSSEGPTPDGVFKPDLCAPGTSILSSSLYGGYAYASGTSMSAPHVSGAAALLKQAFPEYSNNDIRSLLINYSDVVVNPYTHKPYSWLRQGAGKLNVLNAYEGSVTIQPSTLVISELDKTTKSKVRLTFQCHNKKEENITLSWKINVTYQGIPISFRLDEEVTALNALESKTIKKELIISDFTYKEKDAQWLEFNLIGYADGKAYLHIPGLISAGSQEVLDPNPISFCFPTLAISPNFDGNSDSNYFYFLSSFSTNGYQVDLWNDQQTDRVGVIDYGQYENSAGYFQVLVTGEVQGNSLEDNFYTLVPYLLKKGTQPDHKENWIQGKSAKLLVDRVPPSITLLMEYKPSTNEIKGSGKIQDNHGEFGLFLMYELDYDEADLIDVNPDGTFSFEIQPESEFGFIAFTAQDIAGNTYRIKKRLK